MVDSRKKGSRGEYIVRDLLREYTGLEFERVPSSGALSYLKGDLYLPHDNNRFCIEVKNYEESPLTDKIFTNKSSYLPKWWEKIKQQAENSDQDPLLFFRYNRSQVYVVTELQPVGVDKFMYLSWLECYIMLAKEWLESEKIKWVKPGRS